MQGRDLVSKVVGIWWPIFAFVGLGFDHVVANMTFIPLGIFQHTPGLTVGLYIWKGIIPAGLGNIIGGALFCGKSLSMSRGTMEADDDGDDAGGYYWYMYLNGEGAVAIDGVFFDEESTAAPSHGNGGITRLWRKEDSEAHEHV